MEPINIPVSPDPRRIPCDGTILVAHQPEFLPYLGNISKATMGDVYVLLDTVQFEKQHWQSRNKIRVNNPDGWQWLIIMLKAVGNHMMQTDEVILDGDFWKTKHLKSIRFAYSKSPFFNEIFEEISAIYHKQHIYLVDFLVDIILYAFKKFNVNIPVYRSSELIAAGYDIEGKKSDHLTKICQVFNAKNFVFGRDGATYVDRGVFDHAGVKPLFQDFHHPVYTQSQPGDFVPYMSFIDLLFNHGSQAVDILGSCTYQE